MLDTLRYKNFEPLHSYVSISIFFTWCVGIIIMLKKIEKNKKIVEHGIDQLKIIESKENEDALKAEELEKDELKNANFALKQGKRSQHKK